MLAASAYAPLIDELLYQERLPETKVRFSEKSKPLFGEPKRELREFSVKGHKVMAYSRKDAITRLKHLKKI